jgi:hypothetical protein
MKDINVLKLDERFPNTWFSKMREKNDYRLANYMVKN